MKYVSVFLAFTGVFFISAPLRADNEDVPAASRQACTPDVLTLCGPYIPNRARITSCLLQQEEKLSAACHAVMFGDRGKPRNSNKN